MRVLFYCGKIKNMFLHTFHPSSTLFELNFIKIHWYGFLIFLAVILGFFIFYKLARKTGFKKDFIFDLTFWLIIWGIIGGRIYHILSELGYYWQNPLKIFFIWNGGMGIFGAVIAGLVVVYYFSLRHFNSVVTKERHVLKNKFQILRHSNKIWVPQNNIFYKLLDLLTPALALGQSIGRWGNYFNQELYGLPSNLPWAIPIDFANRLPGFKIFNFFQPLFLYESLFCFLIFIILISLIKRIKPGFIFLLYMLLYSSWRFLIEFFRIDHQPIFLNLRLGQWVSLGFIIFAVVFYFVLKKWYNKKYELFKNIK